MARLTGAALPHWQGPLQILKKTGDEPQSRAQRDRMPAQGTQVQAVLPGGERVYLRGILPVLPIRKTLNSSLSLL